VIKLRILSLLFLLPLANAFAQTRELAFQFLDQPSFTRLSALGGVNVTSNSELLFFMQNPASLNEENSNVASFHYLNFPGGINWGSAGYQWSSGFEGEFAVGLQLVSYGEFEGFDRFGVSSGDFSAQEFNLQLSYSRAKGIFNYGATLKLMGSILESYQAYGIALDLGVIYDHPKEDLRIGFVVKNLGLPISGYLPDQKLRLPSDVRFGASFKPKYMPVKFSWTLRNLNSMERGIEEPDSFGRQALEKMVWGAEILPSENISLQIGYNLLMRRQFSGNSGAGSAGFSGGFAFRVKSFELSYARSFYNVAGASNVFGVSKNLRKKRSF